MNGFVATLVGLPPELKAAIAVLVMLGLRALLSGRVPDAVLTELAGVITTALLAGIGILLGLIPAQFEAVATAILQLIAVLVGTILVVRAYLVARHAAQVRGFRF